MVPFLSGCGHWKGGLGGGWSLRGVHPKKCTCLPKRKKYPPAWRQNISCTHRETHTHTCLAGLDCELENELEREGGKDTLYGSCCSCCWWWVDEWDGGKKALPGRDVLLEEVEPSACRPPWRHCNEHIITS